MGIFIGKQAVDSMSVGRQNIEEAGVGRYPVLQGGNFISADGYILVTADGFIFNAKE